MKVCVSLPEDWFNSFSEKVDSLVKHGHHHAHCRLLHLILLRSNKITYMDWIELIESVVVQVDLGVAIDELIELI